MIGLGSIVNAAAIVAGGCVGLVAGKAISERARATLVSGMAVGTLFVGASSTFCKMLSVGDGGAVECRAKRSADKKYTAYLRNDSQYRNNNAQSAKQSELPKIRFHVVNSFR